MSSRPPAVEGSFYPAEAGRLATMVRGYLAAADADANIDAAAPKAIIAPHAGYIYSGAVAASAYARLHPARENIRRVVLLGPAHRAAVHGLATVSVDSFTTPLGDVAIDHDALRRVSGLPQVTVSDAAHAQEHSLETQLPFLQTCLARFKLAPFVVGEATPRQVAQALEALWGGDDTLIVISTDLSHYHDYPTARRLDQKTSDNITRLRYENIGYEDACGRTPLNGLLYLAVRRGYGVQTLDLRNSGDTAGDKTAVVGYGAYMLTAGKPARRRERQRRLLHIARRSIQHGLQTRQPLPIAPAEHPPALRRKQAAFVTLKQNGRLRGCIGSLRAHRPLVADISENAFAAAFRDPRFAPLGEDELATVDIEISVLGRPRPLRFRDEQDLIRQLRPGVDGLIVEEHGHSEDHSGVFLPAVWEQFAEPRRFWRELKRKAGLEPDHWSDTLTVSRYTAQKFGEREILV